MPAEITIPSFYEYLETERRKDAALTSEEMDALRKEYNRYRNRLYKKRQRERHTEVPLFLNNEDFKLLKDAAARHKLITAHYIRVAALKYTTGTYLVPDAGQLSNLVAQLEGIKKSIETMANRKKGFLSKDQDYYGLSKLVYDMQDGLLGTMTKPVNVEQWVVNELESNPEFKRKLLELLLSSL